MTNNLTLPFKEIALTPSVRAFFSKRDTDSHLDPYSGFNICHYTGDDPQHIELCRKSICRFLGIDSDRLIIPRQTHSTNIAVIDSIPFDNDNLIDVDALITPLKNVALAINTADCLPIILAEDDAGIIAALHSGWRGTIGNIAGKTVNRMRQMGASPLRMKAYIGVSICDDCFEVGDDVAFKFLNTFGYNTNIIQHRKPKRHIDLQLACRFQLTQAGIPDKNIYTSGICPHCNSRQYFSARTLGIKSGRTATVIMRQ